MEKENYIKKVKKKKKRVKGPRHLLDPSASDGRARPGF
jgi:hypothetical protein